jgi:hypothetical protein
MLGGFERRALAGPQTAGDVEAADAVYLDLGERIVRQQIGAVLVEKAAEFRRGIGAWYLGGRRHGHAVRLLDRLAEQRAERRRQQFRQLGGAFSGHSAFLLGSTKVAGLGGSAT